MDIVEALWADFASPIVTADDYVNSLRGRSMNVFFMGERVPEPVEHPVIRPSINAMAETYRLASERPELATVRSDIAGLPVNRFLHVPTSPADLVSKHEMQRELGRRTGTCFQRCVGLDAIGACHSVTFDIDGKNGSDYHERFLAFLRRAQAANGPARKSLIVFDQVFVPHEHVFMDGESSYASSLVERFTTYHRSSYVCKTGLGDVLIGAAASAAEHNGVETASHIRDKLVEMTHLNETIYSSCLAAAHQSKPAASGAYINDDMLSNVAKHNVTHFPFEIARLAQDIAGGLIVTMPSEKDLQNNEIGPLIRKFLQGRDGVEVTDRMRILRLIENMTIGRNAVGYLTESLHGAGSPQAQRIQIARGMKLDEKKARARKLAGVTDRTH